MNLLEEHKKINSNLVCKEYAHAKISINFAIKALQRANLATDSDTVRRIGNQLGELFKELKNLNQ